MLKAQIKKEITITNKEIAQYLWEDGSLLDHIDEVLEHMLYNEYRMDYGARCGAVEQLTPEDYTEILKTLADMIK